ncbi:hypothetical protein ASPWEDRAFT_115647 [Aspergillus wentii DTO 134E9]|uniref:DUF7137 domain-containing protein n=1 Tax=Aspergillus wentii DTO 134E9 TaxID=1073089 RepID=A0A1L9RE83_ASPWE|nr:uncharacterized protein ASPWEDRAFT_115647 [Aspergillus wentii DTO 134E9]KAI9933486.1 hypothetical protein MW887_007959 [Aspergillus wentii]OJJ33232.1 hypothetical protein ASPWEDRAFT_115647 [Aspergillus wentii DTO 134E9]
MRSFILLSVLFTLLLGTLSTAWELEGLKLARDEFLGLGRRDETTAADSATTGSSPSTTETASETGTATDTDTATTGTGTNTNTGTESSSETGTATGTATKTKGTSTSSTSIDARLPAGGISMITPSNGATTYYKVGEYVTFKWNYTSLSVTPSAVNVVASCSLNDATYTISNNMSVEATGAVTWDTGDYQASATIPLLTATYTLIVYDVDSSIGDTASAGHLGSSTQFNFGMYLPQPYTPLNEYKCATCSGAMSGIDRQAIKFAMGMAAITIFSFTWFAGNFGVFAT